MNLSNKQIEKIKAHALKSNVSSCEYSYDDLIDILLEMCEEPVLEVKGLEVWEPHENLDCEEFSEVLQDAYAIYESFAIEILKA